MEGLGLGRVVIYQVNEDEEAPGMVTKIWDQVQGCVNLVVFGKDSASWPTSVMYSEIPALNTWHWPARV